MKKIGYHQFFTCLDGPMSKPGSGKRSSVMAVFYFDKDVSILFPYVNAVTMAAQLHDRPSMVRFKLDDVFCVLYPKRCIATPFVDRQEAKAFRDKMMIFLNDILEKINSIVPKYKIFKKIPVTDIIRLLPKNNCKECGFPTCMAFAAMLSSQSVAPSLCPHIGLPINEQVTYPVFDANGNPVSSITLNVDSNQKNVGRPMKESDEKRLDQSISKANESLIAALTKRELEVLAFMGKGQTNREIAIKLNISPHTVKSHVINIFNKLGVSDRTQAAVWAVRHQLF